MTEVQKSSGNVAAVIAYLIGPIYLLLEKENKEIRFHALQATFLMLALIAINFLVSMFRLWFLSSFVSFGAFILWVILAVKAYRGEKVVLPVIGEMAQKYA